MVALSKLYGLRSTHSAMQTHRQRKLRPRRYWGLPRFTEDCKSTSLAAAADTLTIAA